ncbi:MAG TPA: inosine/xanthosine triphosphatase [Patescibacteria group bacterium]
MKINVGSTNKTKIKAVRETLILYPKLFPNPEILGINVDVPEFGHPKNLKETILGAKKRAKKAFKNCDYSIGIEGGLMKVPLSENGFMEVNAGVIYNGKEYFIGLSPAFSWPKKVTELILSGKADASLALKNLGITNSPKLGSQEGGAVGMLTDNRMTREVFIKYSLISALIYLEKPEIK